MIIQTVNNLLIGSTLPWSAVLAPVTGYINAFQSVTAMIQIFYDYMQHTRIEHLAKGETKSFATRNKYCNLLLVSFLTIVATLPCLAVVFVFMLLTNTKHVEV